MASSAGTGAEHLDLQACSEAVLASGARSSAGASASYPPSLSWRSSAEQSPVTNGNALPITAQAQPVKRRRTDNVSQTQPVSMDSGLSDLTSNVALHQWVSALTAAVQQAHQKGDEQQAKALLASITSMASVQSPLLHRFAAGNSKSQSRERGAPQPSLHARAPSPGQQSSPAPGSGDVGSQRLLEALRGEETAKPSQAGPALLQQQLPTMPTPHTGQSVAESGKVAQALPSRQGDSRFARPQATNFRVYSNAFQNRNPPQRAACSSSMQQEPAADLSAEPNRSKLLSSNSQAAKSRARERGREEPSRFGDPWGGAAKEEGSQWPGQAPSALMGQPALVAPQRSKPAAAEPAAADVRKRLHSEMESSQGNPPPTPSSTPYNSGVLDLLPGAAGHQGEHMASWLQQRYNSLGQAMSISEANINRLNSQASSTLPLVLARLQAAQQLQGAAAAQGGLPAAAALVPLMQLQALVQSIGSVSGSVTPLTAAIPKTSPFSSLEAWRENFNQRHARTVAQVQSHLQTVGSSSAMPSAGPLADFYLESYKGDPASSLNQLPGAQGKPLEAPGTPLSHSSGPPPQQWPGVDAARTGRGGSSSKGADGVYWEPAAASEVWGALQAQGNAAQADSHRSVLTRPTPSRPDKLFGSRMPDPHNPFEMHRVRLAREDKPASPEPLFSKPEAAQPHRPEQADVEGAPRPAHLISFQRSAPPLTAKSMAPLRLAAAGDAPRAATVKRSESRDTEDEAEEQAAETLLSLFGPAEAGDTEGHPLQAQATKAVRQPRTQRTLINGPRPVLGTAVPHAVRSSISSMPLHSPPESPQSSSEDPEFTLKSPRQSRRSGSKGKGRLPKDADKTWMPKSNARKAAAEPGTLRAVRQRGSDSELTQSV